MYRKTIKYIVLTVLGVLGLFILYLVSAYVLSIIPTSAETDPNKGQVDIYILTNGMHTDIVMPVKNPMVDWRTKFKYDDTLGKDSIQNYVGIGWGDKGFYLEIPEWSDLTVKIAARAAFGFSNTALHVTYYKEMVEGEDCVKIPISQQQYERLVQYIEKSMQKNEKGDPIFIQTNAQYGDTDSFYEAIGSYSMLHTCNTWSNNALKSTGQKACLWTPSDKGIFYHYK
jgi:uncharacterized protein (TIGR02117 family)